MGGVALLALASCSAGHGSHNDAAVAADGSVDVDVSSADVGADGPAEHLAGDDGASRDAVVDSGSLADAPTDGDARDAPADAARDAADAGAADASDPALCPTSSPWFDLPYIVGTAAYSRAVDRLLMAPVNDPSLRILDPEGCGETIVPLPRPALAIALAPGGRTAAIAHDASVSVVDLATGTLVNNFPVPIQVDEIAFASGGQIFVHSYVRLSAFPPLLSVAANNGTIQTDTKIDSNGHLHITPDGMTMYWVSGDPNGNTTQRIDLPAGIGQVTNFNSNVPICANLFPLDDSQRLLSGCGAVLRIVNGDVTHDPMSIAALPGVSAVQSADSLVAAGVIALLETYESFTDLTLVSADDHAIHVHDLNTYNPVKSISLPSLESEGVTGRPSGRFVFVRSDGSRYYVVGRRGAAAGQLRADGVVRLDASTPGGDAGTTASSVHLPTPTHSPHEGLPAALTVPKVAVRLAFDTIDAGYSGALNRLVVTSMVPSPAVYLVDPDTGAAETIATPVAPSRVYVRPDGLVATVVRQGGVTFLDLVTHTVLLEQEGPVMTAAFGPAPQVLTETAFTNGFLYASWVDTSTAVKRSAFSMEPLGPLTPNLFATVPNTLRSYAIDTALEVLRRHDDVTAAGDPIVDLTLLEPDVLAATACQSLWVDGAGSLLTLNCARAFRLSTVRANDMVYAGGFERTQIIRDVVHSQGSGRMLVVPYSMVSGDSIISDGNVLAIYDDARLNLRALIGLESLGLRVFLGSDPNQPYVVEQVYALGSPTTTLVEKLDLAGL